MNWDTYFKSIATTVAQNSKCRSRQIGAVLVYDKSIISTGYNGPPRGYPPCGDECPRKVAGFESGEALEMCVAAHAETNAIANAARHGVVTRDSTLYLHPSPIPCKNCMALIVNAGIVEVVVDRLTDYDSLGIKLAHACGVRVRTFRWNAD